MAVARFSADSPAMSHTSLNCTTTGLPGCLLRRPDLFEHPAAATAAAIEVALHLALLLLGAAALNDRAAVAVVAWLWPGASGRSRATSSSPRRVVAAVTAASVAVVTCAVVLSVVWRRAFAHRNGQAMTAALLVLEPTALGAAVAALLYTRRRLHRRTRCAQWCMVAAGALLMALVVAYYCLFFAVEDTTSYRGASSALLSLSLLPSALGWFTHHAFGARNAAIVAYLRSDGRAPFRYRQRRLCNSAAQVAASVAALAAWASYVQASSVTAGPQSYAGWAVGAALLLFDCTMLVRQALPPPAAVLAATLARAAVVLLDANYWFIAVAVVYVLWAAPLTWSIAVDFVPCTDAKSAVARTLDDLAAGRRHTSTLLASVPGAVAALWCVGHGLFVGLTAFMAAHHRIVPQFTVFDAARQHRQYEVGVGAVGATLLYGSLTLFQRLYAVHAPQPASLHFTWSVTVSWLGAAAVAVATDQFLRIVTSSAYLLFVARVACSWCLFGLPAATVFRAMAFSFTTGRRVSCRARTFVLCGFGATAAGVAGASVVLHAALAPDDAWAAWVAGLWSGAAFFFVLAVWAHRLSAVLPRSSLLLCLLLHLGACFMLGVNGDVRTFDGALATAAATIPATLVWHSFALRAWLQRPGHRSSLPLFLCSPAALSLAVAAAVVLLTAVAAAASRVVSFNNSALRLPPSFVVVVVAVVAGYTSLLVVAVALRHRWRSRQGVSPATRRRLQLAAAVATCTAAGVLGGWTATAPFPWDVTFFAACAVVVAALLATAASQLLVPRKRLVASPAFLSFPAFLVDSADLSVTDVTSAVLALLAAAGVCVWWATCGLLLSIWRHSWVYVFGFLLLVAATALLLLALSVASDDAFVRAWLWLTAQPDAAVQVAKLRAAAWDPVTASQALTLAPGPLGSTLTAGKPRAASGNASPPVL